ncbi:MAG TPA: hypothetical protein PKE55_00020 [Kiritimatiellia bacterium]|nr:hypothetical protein [Kiritimatiellia bacterium]
MKTIAMLFSTIIITFAGRSWAQPPSMIHYQGRLLENAALLNGQISLELGLYNQAAGGTLLFLNSNTVTVVDGLYEAMIGDNPIHGSLSEALTHNQVWLEVIINGVPLSPRERLVSVPYALSTSGLQARDVNTIIIGTPAGSHAIGTGVTHSVIGGGFQQIIYPGAQQSVIGGGRRNIIGTNALHATIPGGFSNLIGPDTSGSFAAGRQARANHSGTFVWNDGASAFASTSTNQFLIRAQGGVGIGANNPTAQLDVDGQVRIRGGTPGEGKILVSDADGLARWEQNPFTLFGMDFSPFIEDVIDNSALIEISGVGVFTGLVVHGPGYTIERIPGFGPMGRPNDQSGLNVELPLVFDAIGPITNQLNAWYQAWTNGTDVPRDMSIVVRNPFQETYRINSYLMFPAAISNGVSGRTRYTLLHDNPPDMNAAVDRIPFSWPSDTSFNPGSDGPRVEISGVSIGPYPVVEIDSTDRIVTLTFDYVEGGDILPWVHSIASQGTPNAGKRDMSVIYEDNFVELYRTNYYGVFPIHYQIFTGFGQDIKGKERVVLSYDFEELL